MNPGTERTCRERHASLQLYFRKAFVGIALTLSIQCLPVQGQETPANAAAALQAKRIELQPQLRSNPFHEPLHLSSRQENKRVEGDIHAEVANPFAEVTAAFKSAATVCELLLLHLNVRACHPAGGAGNETVTLALGPKRALTSGELYHVTYALRIEAAGPAYFRATMRAPKGPLGTRDYRILVEAMPIGDKRSFVHMGYSYGYGAMAKMAMDLYLATAGRAKIGFTITGRSPEGKPVYVGGERGSLERNVMRYYLALLAYSSITTGSPQEKMTARLRKWFALTERYPAQLHELNLDEYLEEKYGELAKSGFPMK